MFWFWWGWFFVCDIICCGNGVGGCCIYLLRLIFFIRDGGVVGMIKGVEFGGDFNWKLYIVSMYMRWIVKIMVFLVIMIENFVYLLM